MQIINALLISTIAGLSTVIGGLVIFFRIKNIDKFITFCLSFTAVIMIGISVIELFPESFFTLSKNYSMFLTIIIILIVFVLGIFIIRLTNKLINNSDNLYKIGILNMIVLILHNFPEGITTFITSYHDLNIGLSIAIAIMLHNIPEGVAIAVPIYCSTKSKKKALLKTFLSGISEPIGALFAFIFLKNYINDVLIAFLLIVVCAIMITLSIEKLIPEAINRKSDKSLKMGFIIGIIVLFVSLFIL